MCARHIGGAINYVGVADTLDMSAAAQAAGLAADNLMCAVYFATLFNLARNIAPDPEQPAGTEQGSEAAAPSKPGITVISNARPVIM